VKHPALKGKASWGGGADNYYDAKLKFDAKVDK
jgi:hypothetical protein